MDLIALPRMSLVFVHLLLCVFALQCVLSTDWRLLHGRIGAARLLRVHQRVAWLLGALWLSGLLLVGLETGFDANEIAARPKLLGKLVCVVLLTANGALLRLWCFPRLVTDRPLGRFEAMALMACGAVSTTSWLMAAFFGVARALNGWPLGAVLGLYAAAIAVAVPVALSLHGRLHAGRLQRAARRGVAPVAPAVEAPPAVATLAH